MIPKKLEAHIRNQVTLSVAIRLIDGMDYVGSGTIKQVRILKNQPNLAVTLELNIVDPLGRDLRQEVPNQDAKFEKVLDLRVRYDNSQIQS